MEWEEDREEDREEGVAPAAPPAGAPAAARVSGWLARLYGDATGVPPFERDEPAAWEALDALRRESLAADERARAAAADVREAVRVRWAPRARTLAALLSDIGLCEGEGEAQGVYDDARALADAAVELRLERAEPEAMLAEAAALAEECLAVARERADAEAAATAAQDALLEAQVRLRDATRWRADGAEQLRARRADAARLREDMSALRARQDACAEQAHTLRATALRAGYDERFSHSAIDALAGELEAAHARLVPLEARLREFNSLPLDAHLARRKLDSAREQLRQIEEALDSKLEDIQI